MGGPVTRRFTEQRWLLDTTIRTIGMDWDQPRSFPSERWFVEATGRIVRTAL